MNNKTRYKLVASFEALISQPTKDVSTLTVQLLAKEAGINRVTFYRQFTDMLDFLKWYILKDFIFHYQGASSFTFKDAYEQIFTFIRRQRKFLYFIFTSSYGDSIKEFVLSEVYAYQIRNFNHLDTQKVLTHDEVHSHASFYAAGITHNILSYILDDKIFQIDPYQYSVYQLRIVKEYVERAIARKNAKLYDGLKES